MIKQKIVNLKELIKISDKLSESLNTLQMLEPFIKFKDRNKYKKTYKSKICSKNEDGRETIRRKCYK